MSLKDNCDHENANFQILYLPNDKDSQLQHKVTGQCIAISKDENSLVLAECNKTNDTFYTLQNEDKGNHIFLNVSE